MNKHHQHTPSPAPAPAVATANITAVRGRFVQFAEQAGTPVSAFWWQVQGCGTADTDPDAQKDFIENTREDFTVLQNTDNALDIALCTEAHDYAAAPYSASGNYPTLAQHMVFPRANGAWPGFKASDFAQFIQNCQASGKWPIPDHSNRGVVAGESL